MLVLRAALFALVAVAALFCAGQERLRPEQRQELWTSVGVKGKAPKLFKDLLGKDTYDRIRLSGELGYRSADAFFAGRQVYLDLGGQYELAKWIDVGVEHRYAVRPGNTARQRTGIMANVSHEIDRFELRYRFNYQHNYREWGDVREVFRNRFQVGYNIPKWKLDPAFSMEFFTWAGYRGWTYFGTRYKLGTEWKLSKGQELGFALVHDRERAVATPTYRTIFSVSYGINLNKL